MLMNLATKEAVCTLNQITTMYYALKGYTRSRTGQLNTKKLSFPCNFCAF